MSERVNERLWALAQHTQTRRCAEGIENKCTFGVPLLLFGCCWFAACCLLAWWYFLLLLLFAHDDGVWCMSAYGAIGNVHARCTYCFRSSTHNSYFSCVDVCVLRSAVADTSACSSMHVASRDAHETQYHFHACAHCKYFESALFVCAQCACAMHGVALCLFCVAVARCALPYARVPFAYVWVFVCVFALCSACHEWHKGDRQQSSHNASIASAMCIILLRYTTNTTSTVCARMDGALNIHMIHTDFCALVASSVQNCSLSIFYIHFMIISFSLSIMALSVVWFAWVLMFRKG